MNPAKPQISHIVIRILFYGLVLLMGAGVLYSFRILFGPLLASVLLALLLGPLVNYLETRGVPRALAIIGIYVLILGACVVGGMFVVPMMINEAQNLAADAPRYKALVQEQIAGAQAFAANRFPQVTIPDLYGLMKEKGALQVQKIVAAIPEYTTGLLSVLSVAVIVPIVTFFLLTDGYLIRKALLRMVPNRYFEMFVLLQHKVVMQLQLFIRGQLIDALAVGILTSIGLACIQLPYFLVIGIIAGVGNLIPYLGPIIGFIPALFVVLVGGDVTAMEIAKVVIVFVMVQFIEGTFVYPIAVGKSVDLHPLLVIIGITVGGQFGGVIGMIVAIPLISVCKVTIEVLYWYLKSYSII